MEFDQILQLISAVSDSKLASFEIEKDGARLFMTTDKMPAADRTGSGMPIPAAVSVQTGNTGSSAAGTEKTAAVSQAETDQAAERETTPEHAAADSQRAAHGSLEEQIVRAPLVGIFYAAPSEGAEPYVKVGDPVKKGQVIGIIEAMKLMNEIECEYDGVVDAVLIENEQVVEYGQPLFRIRQA